MKILMHLRYLGTNYCGYQIQPNGMTVQQRLNEATEALLGYACDIVGCSRTDSGVHANHFCATVSEKGKNHLVTTIPIERFPLAIAQFLPEDISVFFAEWVSDEFHPRYNVKSKEYVYLIWNHPCKNPFLTDRAWHYAKPISDETLEKMNLAAAYFCGTHDFTSYMAIDTKITDAVRTIYEAGVKRNGDMIEFHVRADGFLYNMVRILTGTLIAVAEGKIDPKDICSITAAKDRSKAGITVPSRGLYLNRVIY
jgi:tRNA pseudouridine38-40 synthase